MQELTPYVVTISLLGALIVVLSVFFTLWAPVYRWINGDNSFEDDSVFLNELKGRTVNIHLKSKIVLEGVELLGYFGRYKGTPNELRQVLVGKRPQGPKFYIRFETIEYLENIQEDAKQAAETYPSKAW
jgi:hypothetical protein